MIDDNIIEVIRDLREILEQAESDAIYIAAGGGGKRSIEVALDDLRCKSYIIEHDAANIVAEATRLNIVKGEN